MSSIKQDYTPTFRNRRQSRIQNGSGSGNGNAEIVSRPSTTYTHRVDENPRPEDIIKRLPETIRQRFYKTPTLGPYLELIIQHCILVKKTNYLEILEDFINEYETLIKTDPRTGVIRAYARKVIGKNVK